MNGGFMTSISVPKLDRFYEKALLIVLGLFFFCSLESITEISATSAAKFFTLGRYISYLLLAALGFLNLCNRQISSPIRMLRLFFQALADHLFFVFFGFCTVIISIQASVIEPIIIALVLLACWKTDPKKIMKVILYVDVFFFVMTIALAYAGLIPNEPYERLGQVRKALGFVYPLELQSFLFFIVLSFFYVYEKYANWIVIALIAAIDIFFYMQTKARFSAFLILVTCILFFGYRYLVPFFMKRRKLREEKNREKASKKAATAIEKAADVTSPVKKSFKINWGWVFVIVFLAVLAFFYYLIATHTFWSVRLKFISNFLDKIFNNRMILGRGAYVDYDFRTFGQTIEWIGLGGVHGDYLTDIVGKSYNYVDVSYYKNLFDYGFMWMIYLLSFYLITWLKAYNKKNWGLCIIIMMILAEGFFEPRLSQIAINPFLILGAQLLMYGNAFYWKYMNRIRFYA